MNSHHPETNAAASPNVMVIFGATGDLTKRKLIPALCNLAATTSCPNSSRSSVLPPTTSPPKIFARSSPKKSPSTRPLQIDLKIWDWFKERIYYVKGDFSDPEAYKRLAAQIAEADKAPRRARQ